MFLSTNHPYVKFQAWMWDLKGQTNPKKTKEIQSLNHLRPLHTLITPKPVPRSQN